MKGFVFVFVFVFWVFLNEKKKKSNKGKQQEQFSREGSWVMGDGLRGSLLSPFEPLHLVPRSLITY